MYEKKSGNTSALSDRDNYQKMPVVFSRKSSSEKKAKNLKRINSNDKDQVTQQISQSNSLDKEYTRKKSQEKPSDQQQESRQAGRKQSKDKISKHVPSLVAKAKESPVQAMNKDSALTPGQTSIKEETQRTNPKMPLQSHQGRSLAPSEQNSVKDAIRNQNQVSLNSESQQTSLKNNDLPKNHSALVPAVKDIQGNSKNGASANSISRENSSSSIATSSVGFPLSTALAPS
jgi:FtsZ-interacting cell division protein ZipA